MIESATMTTIRVAKDFSATPGGRYRRHGPYSGEEFREVILLPRVRAAQAQNQRVVVDFDGVAGIPSSFLEEAFGGLIRVLGHAIEGVIEIRTTDPSLRPYVLLAQQFMKEATV